MSSDAHFIKLIRTNFCDETPRLVYADWLEERHDPRAEYLRLECALARGEPDESAREGFASSAVVDKMRRLLTNVDRNWLLAIGLPFDVFIAPAESDRGQGRIPDLAWIVATFLGGDAKMVRRIRAKNSLHQELCLLHGVTWYDAMAIKTHFTSGIVSVRLSGLVRHPLENCHIVCVRNFSGSETDWGDWLYHRGVEQPWCWRQSMSLNLFFKTFQTRNDALRCVKFLNEQISKEMEVDSRPGWEFAKQTRFTPFLEAYFGDTYWTW